MFTHLLPRSSFAQHPLTSAAALLAVAILLSGLASGCSSGPSVTTNYQENRDRTVYETEPMRLSNVRLSSSYRSPPRFYAIVSGRCEGRDCSPASYEMRIVVNREYPISMGERTLTLSLDENQFTFPAPTQDRAEGVVRVSGIITNVKVDPDQLRQIARSSSVRGELGGIPFQLSKNSREPMVELLVQTNTMPAPDTNSSR